MISFALPWAFLLAPLPVLAWRLLPPEPQKGAVRAPESVIAHLKRHSDTTGRSLSGIGDLALKVIGWIALIIALAGPFIARPALLTPTGRDIVVAVDLSASMAEEDMIVDDRKTARIEVIRQKMATFLRSRAGDRVALIGFAEEAYLIAPLTFDVRAAAEMLSEAPIGLPGRKTDLGRAIGLSVKLLREEEEGERLLILISDGEANAGELAATDAAELAKEIGLKIFAIGFASDLDEANAGHMADLAETSGGRFTSADSAEAMGLAATIVSDSDIVARPESGGDRRTDLRWAALIVGFICFMVLYWREAQDP